MPFIFRCHVKVGKRNMANENSAAAQSYLFPIDGLFGFPAIILHDGFNCRHFAYRKRIKVTSLGCSGFSLWPSTSLV